MPSLCVPPGWNLVRACGACRPRFASLQNLALALLAMVFATLPTVAGFIPLWLAVLMHEGSTLLVALNSLRLLLDPEVRVVAIEGESRLRNSTLGFQGLRLFLMIWPRPAWYAPWPSSLRDNSLLV